MIAIAIDGPAASGKGTAARAVAERLGYTYVDTGAMYRAVALAAEERGISWDDATALGRLARSLDLRLEPGPGGAPRVLLDGRDVTEDIRTERIAGGASAVSVHPPVREALVERQRALARAGGVVMDGRDIGTVVLPDAELKVYLHADVEERARRRWREYRERGEDVPFADVLAEVRRRDARDAGRDAAPLRPAADAVVLDTTRLTPDQVVARILRLARARGA